MRNHKYPFLIFTLFFFLFTPLLLPSITKAAGGTGVDMPPALGPGQAPPMGSTEAYYRKAWNEVDNPDKEGWNTEHFNSMAGKQLKQLGKIITHPENLDLTHIRALVTEDCVSEPLRPDRTVKVYEDEVLKVERGLIETKSDVRAASYDGPQGLIKAIKKLTVSFRDAAHLRFKFKLYRIMREDDYVTTRQYFAVSGMTSRGMVEQNATWNIRWRTDEARQKPLIQKIKVEDYEQITAFSPQGPLFTDCTESALKENTSYQGQILRGYSDWLSRIENIEEFALFGTPGIAVGDVNGDGLDDLFVCQEYGLPNLLYLQNTDGTAEDVSEKSGINWLQSCRSALLLDLDNDADQDLVSTTLGNVVVAANDGKGKFSIRAVLPTSDDTMSMSAADYDNDGDLDLYVTGYNPNRRLERTELPAMPAAAANFVYHDANNGPPNTLYRNDISDNEWRFTDVTQNVGLDANNHRFSLAAAWEDYDNDGDLDLYVANDYGRDNLYRNEIGTEGQPRFVDVGPDANIEDSAGGMSVAWGDYNNDGWMDIYLSGMFSSAGNRVTFQSKFKPDASGSVKKRLQNFARGNTLLKNKGDGTFEHVTASAGVEMGRWAWGSIFADLNNDGWEDIVVANGYLTGDGGGGDL